MPKKTKKSENKNRKEKFKDLRYNKYKIMKGKMIVKPENHVQYFVRIS